MGHLLGTFDLSARRLRTCGIALLLGAGLAFVASSQAKTKHQPVKKCRAGYVRRTVHVPKRKHGRIVRVHGKIVYIRVRRCVKVKPHPPKCRAGYVLRSVWVPVRRHGRIVHKHGKIVHKRVWQCVKVKPKLPPPPPPPPPAAAATTATPCHRSRGGGYRVSCQRHDEPL